MKKLKVWQLIVLLVAVIAATVGFALLIVFTSGPGKIKLTDDFLCKEEYCNFYNIEPEEYNEMVAKKESFVIFIDQGGCRTASTLREIVSEYMDEYKVIFAKMSFSDMKETSLSENIKFYPSVAIINKGELVAFLHADSDEDVDYFSDSVAFFSWISQYLLVENSTK